MAKLKIEIEDIAGGKVKIVCTPSFETLMKMDISGNALTPAHGYTIAMLNQARRVSKSNDPKTQILLPKLGRGLI